MMMLLLSLFSSLAFAADVNQLNSVSFEEVNKAPTLTFVFEQPVSIANVEARFIRRTVEWDLSDTKLKKDKLFINVSKADINNVYISHNDENSVRIRVNMDNGKMASNYHERIQYSMDGKKLQFKMDPSIPLISNNIKEISRNYSTGVEPVIANAKAQEHIASVSTLKVAAAKAVATAVASEAAQADAESAELEIDTNAPEAEIPLSVKKAKVTAGAMPSLNRVAAGLFVIAILIVSALMVTRKMKSKKAGAAFNHDSITVISQKYLGPKRNLVLIRVTGEYLLLGVTDHNISLIKNLNVVDDEIPELTNTKNFGDVLDKKAQASAGYSAAGEENYAAAGAEDVEDSFSVSSLADVKKIFKKKRYIDEMDF